MRAEILSTGEEVLSGAIVDSNSAYISGKLDELGVRVERHSTVGDDVSELVAVLREIGARADIAIVTGGLGPTTDDLSAEAAAIAVNQPLVLDPVALAHIASFFQQRGLEMNPANKKQAYFPEGAGRLDNPLGTAPGFAVTIGKCRFYFLPGVPFEMHRMLADLVLPDIKSRIGETGVRNVTRVLLTFGLPESTVSHRLSGFDSLFPRVQLGFQVKYPGIFVKLYSHGENEAACLADIEAAQSWVCKKLERHVVSTEGESMETVVGKLLAQRHETLSIAESCTGGLVSHWLTNVAGSSDYFLFSGVTYSNAAKESILGVLPDTLKTHGAVHEQTVSEMAEGVRRITGATYGLATSGIAGPGGGTPDKPVGTVCIGLAAPDGTLAYRFHFSYGGQRVMKKQMFAMKALDLLRRKLLGDA